MEAVLSSVGSVAGIAGISVVVFLFVVRSLLKVLRMPEMTKKQATSIVTIILYAALAIALAGMLTWIASLVVQKFNQISISLSSIDTVLKNEKEPNPDSRESSILGLLTQVKYLDSRIDAAAKSRVSKSGNLTKAEEERIVAELAKPIDEELDQLKAKTRKMIAALLRAQIMITGSENRMEQNSLPVDTREMLGK